MHQKKLSKIKRFTRRLQDEITGDNVTNFYKAKRTNKQRANLQKYLFDMCEQGTDMILVGEAPGYNGCRLTGVPFTSEYILRKGVCQGKLFTDDNGYKISMRHFKREQTATAMWSVLEAIEPLPLLWNAYPFHPYVQGDVDSNRKPNAQELRMGAAYLRELIEIFEIKKVVAVGNVADQTLHKMNIGHVKVRHPSYGGKKEFKAQLENFFKKT